MKRLRLFSIIAAGLFSLVLADSSYAYKIDMSKYGLVSPSMAYTGVATTSPFDAEYNAVTKKTDIWLTDMDGGYNGRRVFNWTFDESGGGAGVWTFNGAFTTANTSGIRGLSLKDTGNMLIAHEDGTMATYSRSTGVSGYTDLGTQTSAAFSLGGAPHHLAFDGSLVWTVTNAVINGTGNTVYSYDLNGVLQSSFTTAATYIEGVASIGGNIYVYNAGASVYGYPNDGFVGSILKYSTAGVLLNNFTYETGDRPPFHSEALSFDGTHLWMSGYTDGKVYRLAAEQGEKLVGVPEPSTMLLLGSGLVGLGFVRRKLKV